MHFILHYLQMIVNSFSLFQRFLVVLTNFKQVFLYNIFCFNIIFFVSNLIAKLNKDLLQISLRNRRSWCVIRKQDMSYLIPKGHPIMAIRPFHKVYPRASHHGHPAVSQSIKKRPLPAESHLLTAAPFRSCSVSVSRSTGFHFLRSTGSMYHPDACP